VSAVEPSFAFSRDELCREITIAYREMTAALVRRDHDAARTAEGFMNWFLDQYPRTPIPEVRRPRSAGDRLPG
jgi:hypothetical protein